MKTRNIIILALSVVIALLLLFYRGCGPKPEVRYEWSIHTDTVELTTEKIIEIPKPFPIWIVKDTGSIVVLKTKGDPYPVEVIKTVYDTPFIASRYERDVKFNGDSTTAILHYGLTIKGELLDTDFDLQVINKYPCPQIICPDCPPAKRRKNSIGLNAGWMQQPFIGLDYSHGVLGGGVLYGATEKNLGGYLRLKVNF